MADPIKPKSGPNAKDPESLSSMRLAYRTEDKLTDKQKFERQRFVREYLVDFHGKNAGIRCGKSASYAAKFASEMLREPYVQILLHETMQEMDEESLVTRADVLAGLKREANLQGRGASHSARVAAWSKLARITGLETPDKGSSDVYITIDQQDAKA